jgi:hypothetical protein
MMRIEHRFDDITILTLPLTCAHADVLLNQ